MFLNYFKIAIRNLFQSRFYTMINISGLAIGLACFILISLFIKHEFSYENFNEKRDRIYRPVEIQREPGVGEQHVAVTMGPLAKALKSDFPEIEESGRIMPVGELFCEVGENKHWENNAAFADPEILNIFTIPIIKGDPATALTEPFSIILDEELAKKYFGDEDPVGKTITISHRMGQNEAFITGVMKKYPENSHLSMSMLVSISTVENLVDYLKSWTSNSLATYVLLKDNADPAELESKLPAFFEKHLPEKTWLHDMTMYLQPLNDIHLNSGHIVYQTYRYHLGSMNTVVTFFLISIFILLIACINFMNLATARSAKRAREVGIRKVLGSTRQYLIYQFLGESIILTFIALFIALLLVELSLPYFNNLLDHPVGFDILGNVPMILGLIFIALFVGLLAGSYPAFFLSSFKPISTLKGKFVSTRGGAGLRKVLVVLQFAIAIILIINTIMVREQMNFVQNKDLGYNTEQVIALPIRTKNTRDKVELLKTEISKNAGIISVAAASGRNGASGSQGTMTVAGTNSEQQCMMRYSYVDYDFIETLQMKIVKGRNFSREFGTDSSNAVIINEAAARELGWENPIGKQFEWGDNHVLTVIGVVKDFHFYSLHYKIEPLVMMIAPDRYNYVLVKAASDNIEETIEFIESAWSKTVPNIPFEYSFLDEYFAQRYATSQKMGQMFGAFSALAIFIACLGLLGLASFSTEQRTKEIGIRKTLGASVSGIIFLLTKEFSRWVAIASLIAFPIAYWTANMWLDQFVYRTSINFILFLVAALGVIVVALATISYQSMRAALSNPVNALRYE